MVSLYKAQPPSFDLKIYILLQYLYKQDLGIKVQDSSNEDIGQPYSETSIHTLLAQSTYYQVLLSEKFQKQSKMSIKILNEQISQAEINLVILNTLNLSNQNTKYLKSNDNPLEISKTFLLSNLYQAEPSKTHFFTDINTIFYTY